MEQQRTRQILLHLCHSHPTAHCKIPPQLPNETLLSRETIIRLFSAGSLKGGVWRWGAEPCDSQLAPSSLPGLLFAFSSSRSFQPCCTSSFCSFFLLSTLTPNRALSPDQGGADHPLSLNMPTAQCQRGDLDCLEWILPHVMLLVQV